MKNVLSSLTNTEKNRILEMHKTATRKNYLNEQDIDALRSAVPSMMEYYQFNKKYFDENPKGVIQMEPNGTSPSILKINSMDVKGDANFQKYWRPDGTDFGRGFSSGNGVFNYSWDGTELSVVAGTGNDPETCRVGNCYYEYKGRQ